MSNDDLLEVFDAWEPMVKAREAKGIDKWAKLANVSHKLKGKKVEHIKYTCCHPSHEGNKTTHTLGSVQGNLHFLMGYGNPGFGAMAYHYQVMDPLLGDEEADVIFKKLGNPSNPTFWRAAGFDVFPEGEDEGAPHRIAGPTMKLQAIKSGKEVKSGYSTYKLQPDASRVYDTQRDTFYRWSLVKDSYFASSNPEMAAKMNKKAAKRVVPEATLDVPNMVKHFQIADSEWGDGVYPFVKSMFPPPGSVIPIQADDGSTVYGVVRPTSILFVNKNASPVTMDVFAYAYSSFDLKKGGDIHPSILVSFAKTQLGMDMDTYMDIFHTNDEALVSDFPAKVIET